VFSLWTALLVGASRRLQPVGSKRQAGSAPLGLRTCDAWTACLELGKHSATWRLVCFLLGAGQVPRGAWATYTFSIFSIIDSSGMKIIIICSSNIIF